MGPMNIFLHPGLKEKLLIHILKKLPKVVIIFHLSFFFLWDIMSTVLSNDLYLIFDSSCTLTSTGIFSVFTTFAWTWIYTEAWIHTNAWNSYYEHCGVFLVEPHVAKYKFIAWYLMLQYFGAYIFLIHNHEVL